MSTIQLLPSSPWKNCFFLYQDQRSNLPLLTKQCSAQPSPPLLPSNSAISTFILTSFPSEAEKSNTSSHSMHLSFYPFHTSLLQSLVHQCSLLYSVSSYILSSSFLVSFYQHVRVPPVWRTKDFTRTILNIPIN